MEIKELIKQVNIMANYIVRTMKEKYKIVWVYNTDHYDDPRN